MFVSRVRTRNIKSIDTLDVELESQITLLYGPNGIGKSSTLETLSLLGHLNHISIVILANGSFQPQEGHIVSQKLMHSLRRSGSSWDSVERWFAAPKYGGAVSYSLRHETIAGGRPITLYVYIDISPDEATDPSLTSLLSRAIDDEDLRDRLCIVADPSTVTHAVALSELIRQSTAHPRGQDAIVVSYINTDLNDFGRGNDLRESPKDLGRDFASEMQKRLQIPFDGNLGSMRRLGELNKILKTVLRYPEVYVPGMTSDKTSFEITQCALHPETGRLTFTVSRLADNRDYSSIDFLSAGENECVFVFSLLLHLPLRGGLLLLDEPDLHLGPHQKRDFFTVLYQAIRDAGCQCVIATHSEYALAGFDDIGYVVMRPVVERQGSDFVFRYVADAGVDLRLAHSKLLLRRAVQSLGMTGLFARRTFASLWQNLTWLRDQLFYFVNIGVIIVLLVVFAVSASSDVFLELFGQSVAAHQTIAGSILVALAVSVATLVAGIGLSLYRSSSSRRRQRALLEQALAAKQIRRTQGSSTTKG